MNKQKHILALTILILVYSSCVSVLKHNEDTAAIKAVDFARAAFIERNYEKASKFIPTERQTPASIKQIEALVTKMHPTSYPTKVTATAYEPIPGQKAMKIFLIGENQNEKFYYAFVMTGTVDEGYSVVETYRSLEPFQSSPSVKSLSVKRSTDN